MGGTNYIQLHHCINYVGIGNHGGGAGGAQALEPPFSTPNVMML